MIHGQPRLGIRDSCADASPLGTTTTTMLLLLFFHFFVFFSAPKERVLNLVSSRRFETTQHSDLTSPLLLFVKKVVPPPPTVVVAHGRNRSPSNLACKILALLTLFFLNELMLKQTDSYEGCVSYVCRTRSNYSIIGILRS